MCSLSLLTMTSFCHIYHVLPWDRPSHSHSLSPSLSPSFRKKAVEMELAKCKIDIMSLNSQLLAAIQQKLNLSQQLEAWQVGQESD